MKSISSNRKNKLFLVITISLVLMGGYSIFSSLYLQNSKQLYGDSRNRGGTDGIYSVKSDDYGFTKTRSDLDQLLEAARIDNTALISSMLVTKRIKKFPEGKKVRLIEQGYTYIVIEDPDTGIRYYGVSESIY
ncbi:MAG: hypothetical protein HWE07_04980 [Cytophagia bacterium]|nr:hypothetical protein [Cytophagia bacterium]